jgi:hypothetical protein
LIRRFKPEQFPEHFRLIREAYETVKREVQFLGPAGAEAAGAAGPPAVVLSEPGSVPAPPADAPDVVQALWDKACNGQEEEAYGRLRTLYDANPHGSELPARLYALLLANPDLDPRRTPCDWLVQGARAEGPWGPCRQLYRREIDDHPEEALSNRFFSLLDTARGHGIVELLHWRWEALARLDQREWIASDLKRVAPRLERAEEEAWVRLQLRAADYLAWQGFTLFDNLCQTIDNHVHVHAALGEDLARLDMLRELSADWHELLRGPLAGVPLVKVLPLTWTSPFENRHRILLACRAVADDPEAALDQLDGVQRLAPLVAAHLGQTLAWLWYAPADPRDELEMLTAMTGFLQGIRLPESEPDYGLYRRHLLRLCVTECVAPEMVAHSCISDQTSFAFQRIHDDWPLRVACLAHRLIWA